MHRFPLPLLILTAVFAGAIVWLIATSLAPRNVPTFEPRTTPPADSVGTDTMTIDARDPDQWRYFAFDRGLLAPPDTAGWDLAARRFHVITAAATARLDTVSFEAVARVPVSGFVATTYGRDTLNAALARWFRYSMFSHLLRPTASVFVVRTHAGGNTKLEFLSYYCPGAEPGCLTFRYARVGN